LFKLFLYVDKVSFNVESRIEVVIPIIVSTLYG